MSDPLQVQLRKDVLDMFDSRHAGAAATAMRTTSPAAFQSLIGMGEGTIYPLMRRMQADGLVKTYLEESSSGPLRAILSAHLGGHAALAGADRWNGTASSSPSQECCRTPSRRCRQRGSSETSNDQIRISGTLRRRWLAYHRLKSSNCSATTSAHFGDSLDRRSREVEMRVDGRSMRIARDCAPTGFSTARKPGAGNFFAELFGFLRCMPSTSCSCRASGCRCLRSSPASCCWLLYRGRHPDAPLGSPVHQPFPDHPEGNRPSGCGHGQRRPAAVDGRPHRRVLGNCAPDYVLLTRRRPDVFSALRQIATVGLGFGVVSLALAYALDGGDFDRLLNRSGVFAQACGDGGALVSERRLAWTGGDAIDIALAATVRFRGGEGNEIVLRGPPIPSVEDRHCRAVAAARKR